MLAMDSPSRTVCVTSSTGSPTCGKEVPRPSASAIRSPPGHASGGPEPRPASGQALFISPETGKRLPVGSSARGPRGVHSPVSGGNKERWPRANQPLRQRRPHRACFRHGGAPSTTTGGGSLASPDRRRKPSDAPPSSCATFGKSLIAAAVASHGMCCAASRQPRASSASSCRRCAHGIAAEAKRRERVTTGCGLEAEPCSTTSRT